MVEAIMQGTLSNKTPSGKLLPFGAYTALCFKSLHAEIFAAVRQTAIEDAGDAYLYRFDEFLTREFVHELLDTAARAIADFSGRSIPESGRVFQRVVRTAFKSYFAAGWDNVTTLVEVNTRPLNLLRKRCSSIRHCSDELVPQPNVVIPVSLACLESLLDKRKIVMLKVYADYCSSCKKMAPAFEEAARESSDVAIFASMDGPRNPGVKEQYRVYVYPTVLRIERGKGISLFPADKPRTPSNYSAFASGLPLVDKGPYCETCKDTCVTNECDEESTSCGPCSPTPPSTQGHEQLGEWASILKLQGIDELDALVRDRDIVVHMRIDEAIKSGGSPCEVLPARPSGDIPPLCILLGGGMGAGKTSAVSAIAETHFWERHGSNVVCVEADAFKRSDPFFHVLGSVTPCAARVVHADSTAAAEELFLKAVNTRRDVVFDGTLSWCEYARQTVAMLRDTDYLYKRGIGYCAAEDGSVTERYWERAKKRIEPVAPYRVELVGVTVDAATAVARGIVRNIQTGRGVPIADQLQSHGLFSQHFPEYVDLVDSVYLFDMSLSDQFEDRREFDAESIDARSVSAEKIAFKPGVLFQCSDALAGRGYRKDSLVVRNPAAYKRFVHKAKLNTQAHSAEELYYDLVSSSS